MGTKPINDRGEDHVYGDPGVGGILANPLATSGENDNPEPEVGPGSLDPAPPKHHGDWMPNEHE